jgi:hypothetical protein
MNGPDADTLLFFSGHSAALPIYEALEAALCEKWPGTKKRVRKTQITFYDRHVFACVSFQRVRRKAELPEPWLVLTLGLPCPLESERVAVQSEPYPGRWTTHFVLGGPEELDGELLAWIGEAYDFSQAKR